MIRQLLALAFRTVRDAYRQARSLDAAFAPLRPAEKAARVALREAYERRCPRCGYQSFGRPHCPMCDARIARPDNG